MEKRNPPVMLVGMYIGTATMGQYGGSSKKVKIQQPYDTAIPLTVIYREKTIIQKESCTTVFIAALFTIARTWKDRKSVV